MGRLALEVADIFRTYVPAWRKQQAGHLGLAQIKVMSAIEQCRSAALGGHVLRCDACSHEEVSYNSCRNRHCPKCQARAAQRWLEARQASVFVAVLGASSYTFACATPGQTQVDWLAGIGRALKFIGGVTALIVPDNPRALVSLADRYEPELNRVSSEFAHHYDTVILPARPRKPQDKAKVESGVQVVERWILARLRHRRFFSVAELDAAITELLPALNNRPFKKLPGSRRDAFELLDAPYLRPLPEATFVFAEWKKATVNIDYHVEYDNNYYSVPHALIHQAVELRITCRTVEILAKGKRVASHPRSDRKGHYATLAEHMPAAHRAHAEWSPGKLLTWAASVGPSTAELVKRLLMEKTHPEQGYRSCLGLMRLTRNHGRTRVEAACERALAVGAHRYRSVASILEKGLDRQSLRPQQAELALPEHANVRGPGYYH